MDKDTLATKLREAMSHCEHLKSEMFFLKIHLQELKKRSRTWKEDLKDMTKGSFSQIACRSQQLNRLQKEMLKEKKVQ